MANKNLSAETAFVREQLNRRGFNLNYADAQAEVVAANLTISKESWSQTKYSWRDHCVRKFLSDNLEAKSAEVNAAFKTSYDDEEIADIRSGKPRRASKSQEVVVSQDNAMTSIAYVKQHGGLAACKEHVAKLEAEYKQGEMALAFMERFSAAMAAA